MEVVLTNTFQNEFVEKMAIVKQQYAREENVSGVRTCVRVYVCDCRGCIGKGAWPIFAFALLCIRLSATCMRLHARTHTHAHPSPC
jgi:hypothetical protein